MSAWIDSVVAFSSDRAWLLVLLAFVSAASEAMVVVGVLFPGTAVLLAVAAIAGVGADISLAAGILAAAIAGAITGDVFSYWLGRRLGPGLRNVWPLSKRVEWWDKGEAYFQRHGGMSVFIGRFVPGVKTVVPAIAGMSHMPLRRFLAANVASAILWGLVLTLSGLGVGRGLDHFGLADSRLVLLLVMLGVVLLAAYWTLRLVFARAMPALGELHRRLLKKLDTRKDRSSMLMVRLLRNEGGAAIIVAWLALIAAAFVGFLLLIGEIVLDAGFSKADAIISNAVQALRFSPLDSVMVAVTMLGDGIVLGALSLTVLLWLMIVRQWRVAAATALTFALATLFVPVIKALLARERPKSLYEGADAFSFPSGHATHALVVFGVIAVLLAHRLPASRRVGVYAVALSLALLVAFSRIYLGAHWPSDVAGGLLFASGLITAFAFALRDRDFHIRPALMAGVLLVVFVLSYGLNVQRAYTRWMADYAVRPQFVEMTETEWRNGGWETLPRTRITLEDDATPFLAQFSGEPADLIRGLRENGWNLDDSGPTAQVIATLLPFGDFSQLPPSMALHDGRLPEVTLVKTILPGERRLVLRAWASDVLLGAEPPRPLLMIDLSSEIYKPFFFGLADVDSQDVSVSTYRDVRNELAAFLQTVGADTQPESVERPLLLGPFEPD